METKVRRRPGRMKKKKKKMKKETDKDRLSDLPDNIIHHIFSFLDTRFAVQTSLLSKRWKNLWASSPYLHFGHHFSEFLQFKNFVDQVLSRRHDIPLSKLHLGEGALEKIVSYSTIRKGRLVAGRIFEYAASHSLQHLTMCSFHFRGFYILPPVAGIQSLKSLHLSRFGKLYLLSSLDLPMLTSLYVDNCYLASFGSIHSKNVDPFASFINLKSLILIRLDCKYAGNFKISGPQLETLTISWMNGSSAGLKVEIFAPKLKSFSFRNAVTFKSLSLNLPLLGFNLDLPLLGFNLDLPLLEVADIDILLPQEKFENVLLNLINLLQRLHHAQSLKLSFGNIKDLMTFAGVLEHLSSPFSRLKTLKLQCHYNSVDIAPNVMKFFLSGSTSLENISIEQASKIFYLGERYEDRLSDLPDIIIHEIFGFLDAKFAVQTSVLSKRWKNLWTSAPNLHFGSLLSDNFVTQVLSCRCDDIPLTKLYIRLRGIKNSLPYLGDSPEVKLQISLAERVLDYAASHGLQHLSIRSVSPYHAPLAILSPLNGSRSLKTLHLSSFMDVSLLSFFDLPMLTTLYLHRCCFRSLGFGSTLGSIPWLDSNPFASLINLKKLALIEFDCTGVSNLKISGPQLESLTILYKCYSDDIAGCRDPDPFPSLINLKNLVLTKFDSTYFNNLKISGSQLESLTLQCPRSPVGVAGYIDPDPFASLINLKNLVLIGFDCTYLHHLKISGPQLESLTIENMYRYEHGFDFKVEIFAPNLRKFSYRNRDPVAFSILDLPLLEVADTKLRKFSYRNRYPVAFSSLDLPLLEVADIDTRVPHFDNTKKFEYFHLNLFDMLQGLYNAQYLKLSSNTIEVLMEAPAVFEHLSYPFIRLKTLTLQCNRRSLNLPSKLMKYFLSGSTSGANIMVEFKRDRFPFLSSIS